MIKIGNIENLIEKEHEKAKSSYQRALTATISHEQMTPLNSILNLTKMSKENAESCVAQNQPMSVQDVTAVLESLTVVLNSTQVMRLVNSSLLAIQAIQEQAFKLNLSIGSPIQVVHELIEYFRMQIEAKGIVVNFQTDISLPDKVIIDHGRLQEALFHIVVNAIKFNKEFGGKLEIALRMEQGMLVIDVLDSGEGMTQEQIDQSR